MLKLLLWVLVGMVGSGQTACSEEGPEQLPHRIQDVSVPRAFQDDSQRSYGAFARLGGDAVEVCCGIV